MITGIAFRARSASLILGVAGCTAVPGSTAQATAPAAKAPPTTAGKTGGAGPAEKSAAIVQAQRLITTLSSMSDLSRTQVEKVLGVSLQPAADHEGPSALWEATLSDGPFARARLHEPGPQQKFGASLSLQVRQGTALSKRGFDPAWIGPIVDVNPRIPPEGTIAHKPRRADSGTILEFWAKSDQLRQVTFRRAPK